MNMPVINFNSTNNHYDCNPQIKSRLKDILDRSLSDHARVLLIRFDVRYPAGYHAPDDNSIFQQFIENYRRYLNRRGYSPLYLWCREQNLSNNPHYHVCFLLDGTVISKMPNLNKATDIFNQLLDLQPDTKGLIHFSNPYGTMLSRGDQFSYDDAMKYISYLAKTYTKESVKGARSWGSSLL